MANHKQTRLLHFSLIGLAVTLLSFFFMKKVLLVGIALAFLGFLLAGMAIQANAKGRFVPGLFFGTMAMVLSLGSVFTSPLAQGENARLSIPSAQAAETPAR